jgi:hypothetical protein
MRTAIIYCGAARTVSQTYENHRWHLRNLPNKEIFCSVVDDAQADDMLLLRDHTFPGRPFHMEKVVQPEVELWPEKTQFHSGYPRSTSQEGVLKQLWAWNRAWELFCSVANPEDYDVVVRIRPDTAFLRLEVPRLTTMAEVPSKYKKEGYLTWATYQEGVPNDLCLTPRWAKWGGQNDRFAILGKKAAKAYFTTWQKLPTLREQGCPCHPEQILQASLEMEGIQPSATLKSEFVTIRLPSLEHPNGGYFPCEIAGTDLLDA